MCPISRCTARLEDRFSLDIRVVFNNCGIGIARDAAGGGQDEGGREVGGAVGFAMRLGQYFKWLDIRKELTRYARRSLLSQNNPFVRGPGWRRGASPGEGAPEEPRRRPSCCLCNRRRPSHSHPSHGATLYRVPLARLIANNRLTSKSGLILKDNWKGIVPTAFMRKNKGGRESEGGDSGRWAREKSESLVTRQVSPFASQFA